MSQLNRTGARVPTERSSGSWAGRLIGVVLIVAGLFIGSYSANQVAYAVGYQGTHGTLTVEECEAYYSHSRSSHGRRSTRHVECSGTFRADHRDHAGKSEVVPDARVETGVRFEAGERLSVQQSADSFVLGGWDRAWSEVALVFGCVFAVAAGLFALLTGFGFKDRRGPGFTQAWNSLAGGRVLRPVLAGFGGLAVVGTGIALLLDFFAG